MSRFHADHRLCLSQSFRFGPTIAAEANKWLDLLDVPLRLRGFDRIASTVGPVASPDAVLCRSNAEAVRQLLVAADAGRKAALVGGGTEIRRLAEAAISLRAGAGTDHPELFAFRTWGEVQEYVEQDAGGSDLKVFVQLIDTHGAEMVIDIVDGLSPEQAAETVVSTPTRPRAANGPLCASPQTSPNLAAATTVSRPRCPAPMPCWPTWPSPAPATASTPKGWPGSRVAVAQTGATVCLTSGQGGGGVGMARRRSDRHDQSGLVTDESSHPVGISKASLRPVRDARRSERIVTSKQPKSVTIRRSAGQCPLRPNFGRGFLALFAFGFPTRLALSYSPR